MQTTHGPAVIRGVASLVAVAFVLGSVRGEDTDEVKRLKEKVASLETKLKLAEKEIEHLKKELSLTDRSNLKNLAKKTLSDRVRIDTVLAGDESFDRGGVIGFLTITITHREGNKVKASYIWKSKRKDKGVTTRDLEGEINLNQLSFHSVGLASKINISLSMNGDVLNGSVNHSELGKGKLSLRFSK